MPAKGEHHLGLTFKKEPAIQHEEHSTFPTTPAPAAERRPGHFGPTRGSSTGTVCSGAPG